MSKRVSLIVIFMLGAFATGLAQSAAPSLADVAKQTREEKKTAKVFTDEDLPAQSSTAGAANAANQGSASTTALKSADGTPDAKAANTGKADAKQANPSPAKGESATAEMKKKLDRYTEERDGWKKAVQRYEDLLQNETSEFRRQTYQEALEADRHNMELYQQKIDEVQGQLSKTQQESQSSAKEPDNQTGSAGHP